jgi:hypothetical protein
MHKDAVQWAKAQGCDGMTLSGRKGWLKILNKDGWKEQQIVMAKEF